MVYAQAGIEDYWVVNLRDRCVILYRNPAEGRYQSGQTVFSGEVSPLAFPDVAINIFRLLA